MSSHEPLRILAIGAHPDDIELGCAGTLARCIARGDSVTMAVVCKGDAASCGMTKDEIVSVRAGELKDAAKTLGAELIHIGLPDFGVWVSRDLLKPLVDTIRQAKPDVVFTHYFGDYGGDHNNTFTGVLDACLAAVVPTFESDLAPLEQQPFLYMMEPLGGYAYQPQVYVDITETFDVKVKMLECHKSQMDWMSRWGGMDCRQYVDVVARFRGYQCGVTHAEGFIAHNSWAHMPARSILP